jgi:hypothetical protein
MHDPAVEEQDESSLYQQLIGYVPLTEDEVMQHVEVLKRTDAIADDRYHAGVQLLMEMPIASVGQS